MKVGELVRFNEERFFDGAVQLRWVQERPEQAREVATAFVFHGPRYHGAGEARQEGVDASYRLKDTASLVAELVDSFQAGLRGEDRNPFSLAVAGYGTGKSHLSTAIACLLGEPGDETARQILTNLTHADAACGQRVAEGLGALGKPALVLCLDGMAGFHLGNALSQAVFAQLERAGIDAGPIRELSPRFQTAAAFVRRNAGIRAEAFAQRLPGMDADAICAALERQDEAVYTEVDALYADANGVPIPVTGQESAQELIQTLCDLYCGPDGPFSGVLILFDEFGRYLEYAAEKPLLAGDAALQQLFQGVQDNSGKVRFIGLIQYELKTYLKRFGSADLRQLQRYITRFDAADKRYLSTNLETIFAHMIGKDEAGLGALWQQADAPRQQQLSWQRMRQALPGFEQFPVWSDAERFDRVIAQGCWPLHPLATWFLTRQRDLVQSRSALTFIKDVITEIGEESALKDGDLRQVSAAELVLRSMLPEMIAAEQQTGSTVAETLQLLLEKFRGHLGEQEPLLLAGVAVLEKMRVGKQSQVDADALLAEATALAVPHLRPALKRLSTDLGALEWNADLGQYELIADASTRGQFQQWLRQRRAAVSADAVRDLFVARAARDAELGDIETDFGRGREITTPDWFFEASFAHRHGLETALQTAFEGWRKALFPKDAKGRVVYLYLHPDDDPGALEQSVREALDAGLKASPGEVAPIWVVGVVDAEGAVGEHLARLFLFEQLSEEDRERFRRFVPEEQTRSRQALKAAVQEAIKQRLYWVAGLDEVPKGRLKQVGEQIFEQVYPQAPPFPFDGFATANGGGAADASQLMRSLITHQVDGSWVQAQPKRLQNRVGTLLARSWRALSPRGTLTAPTQPLLKAAFDELQRLHTETPTRTLWTSYQALVAPPYGMNASSAGVLLGLLLGVEHPPRRLEQAGEMLAAADWVTAAFPGQRNKHVLDAAVLGKTTLRFLSEDSEGRWRQLLDQWEIEQSYEALVALAKQAAQMQKVEPIPEVLEGRLKYLQDRSEKAEHQLRELKAELTRWGNDIEKAERQNNVGELLRVATRLFRQRQAVEDEGCWPQRVGDECSNLLAMVRELVSEHIADWIPRQGCHSATEVAPFRQRMEKAVTSLTQLGFTEDAKVLESQAQRTIFQVEQRQAFTLTLNQSDDYPRQPAPSSSTPVRVLRDEIEQGDTLIAAVKKATSVLSAEEMRARIKAIEQRQQQLRAMLEQQTQRLGALYSLRLTSEESVQEALSQVQHLRAIFVDTRDHEEVHGLALQLQRIAEDVTAWERGEVPPERLQTLLQQQSADQCAALMALLEQEEIDPAWALDEVYQALVAERVAAAERRSKEWIKARRALATVIARANPVECERVAHELEHAPGYLAAAHQQEVEQLREALAQRRAALDESARNERVQQWRQSLPTAGAVTGLDKHQTQAVLQALQTPPDPLTVEERAELEPIAAALHAHYDQMSIDEILSRIRRLSVTRQRELLGLLAAELGC